MKTFVIVLNWNGKNDTLACLKSLEECRKISSFEIIVVDNGSIDNSVAEIRRCYPQIQILESSLNLGYAGGNNLGIQEALKQGAEGILLLNNDTIASPTMMQAFIHRATTYPEVGIWGGYPLRFDDPRYLDHLGGIWNTKRGEFDLIGLNAPRGGLACDLALDYVCGCSIFIRREVFEKIGLLEPKFFLFWEEADFAMRAKKNGFTIAICPEAVLLHKISASFVGKNPHKKYFWWRGRLLWIERNCSHEEKKRLFAQIIQPQLHHYKKLYWIKRIELALLKLLRKKNLSQKEEKVKQYRAILQGIYDYLTGTFGASAL